MTDFSKFRHEFLPKMKKITTPILSPKRRKVQPTFGVIWALKTYSKHTKYAPKFRGGGEKAQVHVHLWHLLVRRHW